MLRAPTLFVALLCAGAVVHAVPRSGAATSTGDATEDVTGVVAAGQPVTHVAPRKRPRVDQLEPLRHRFGDRAVRLFAELEALRIAEEARHPGEVRYGDDWVALDDLPFVRMRWVEVGGSWWSPHDATELRRANELRAEGWQRRDGEWLPPDAVGTGRADERWVDGQWMSADDADRHRADPSRPWRLVGRTAIVETTLPHADALRALAWADSVSEHLERLVGLRPERASVVHVAGSLDDYNRLASGGGGAPAEASGSSSCHYAFLADAWFVRRGPLPEHRGAGVCYWQPDVPQLDPYGRHAVQHAAALAWMNAVDPSWSAIADAVVRGGQVVDLAKFWSEKRLPLWFHVGAASYCERFFLDTEAEGGDPAWARDWALTNLRAGAPLDLDAVFGFDYVPAEPATTAARIQQAGLVVAYLLDGQDPELALEHRRLLDLLASNADASRTREAVARIEAILRSSEDRLRDWAGL